MSTASNKNFRYRTNSLKITDQIFLYLQKNPIFGLFPQFRDKKNFLKNRAAMHNFISVSGTMAEFCEI